MNSTFDCPYCRGIIHFSIPDDQRIAALEAEVADLKESIKTAKRAVLETAVERYVKLAKVDLAEANKPINVGQAIAIRLIRRAAVNQCVADELRQIIKEVE